MAESDQDIWSRWIFHRRFGGDRQRTQYMLDKYLYPIRNEVLSHAGVSEGDTVLDVGCGDGITDLGIALRQQPELLIGADPFRGFSGSRSRRAPAQSPANYRENFQTAPSSSKRSRKKTDWVAERVGFEPTVPF